jgi:hypothetical protein
MKGGKQSVRVLAHGTKKNYLVLIDFFVLKWQNITHICSGEMPWILLMVNKIIDDGSN